MVRKAISLYGGTLPRLGRARPRRTQRTRSDSVRTRDAQCALVIHIYGAPAEMTVASSAITRTSASSSGVSSMGSNSGFNGSKTIWTCSHPPSALPVFRLVKTFTVNSPPVSESVIPGAKREGVALGVIPPVAVETGNRRRKESAVPSRFRGPSQRTCPRRTREPPPSSPTPPTIRRDRDWSVPQPIVRQRHVATSMARRYENGHPAGESRSGTAGRWRPPHVW